VLVGSLVCPGDVGEAAAVPDGRGGGAEERSEQATEGSEGGRGRGKAGEERRWSLKEQQTAREVCLTRSCGSITRPDLTAAVSQSLGSGSLFLD
jgi:hypothetical protein